MLFSKGGSLIGKSRGQTELVQDVRLASANREVRARKHD